MYRQNQWNDDRSQSGRRKGEFENDGYENRWEEAGDRSTFDQNQGWQGSRQRSDEYDNRRTSSYGWNQDSDQYDNQYENRGRGNSGFYGASDYSQGRQMGYGNDSRGGYYGNSEEFSASSGQRRQGDYERGYGGESDNNYDREYERNQRRYGNEGYREEGFGRGNFGANVGYQDFDRGYNRDSYGQGTGYNEERGADRSGTRDSYRGGSYGNQYDDERGYRGNRGYDEGYGSGGY